jgi:DNA modification methylase
MEGVQLLHGDCLELLKTLPENSIDSVVTDPPYHLTSIVKRFGADDAKSPQFKIGAYGVGFDPTGTGAAFARMSRGFMGKQWDGGDIAFRLETWAEVWRVLKPGGHLLAFGGTRTFARMSVAIEDAGFEIRDTIMWLYGTGFPKSHDVSKGIDRAAGAEREVVGTHHRHGGGRHNNVPDSADDSFNLCRLKPDAEIPLTKAATPEAAQWEGWGTALKPAVEPIVLARKPLSEPTVAANVLRWGTGAINVGACRVPAICSECGGTGRLNCAPQARCLKCGGLGADDYYGSGINLRSKNDYAQPLGRWPANVIHDGSDEVVGAFPHTASDDLLPHHRSIGKSQIGTFDIRDRTGEVRQTYGDSGSAARFFYSAKASKADRAGSKHPTVKPVALMRWLVRMVTPPGGVVLDLFAGSGTTGAAAMAEGFRCVLIEREKEYFEDIQRRLASGNESESHSRPRPAGGGHLDYGPLFATVAGPSAV